MAGIPQQGAKPPFLRGDSATQGVYSKSAEVGEKAGVPSRNRRSVLE
jgi:hypothetical protein